LYYSYHVSKRITGSISRNVAGYAISSTHIAILPSQHRTTKSIEESDSVFVDDATETFYSLNYIQTQDDVRIFSAHEVEPLQVVTHIKFSTRPLNDLATINKQLNVNWEENTDPFVTGRPKPIQFLENRTDLIISAGLYASTSLDIIAEINGFSFTLQAILNFKCTFGMGIEVNNPQFEKDLINLLEKSINISNKLSFEILGCKIALMTYVPIKIDLHDILLKFDIEFSTFKGYYIEFEKIIGISSETGIINPSRQLIIKDISRGDNMDKIKEKIESMDIEFKVTPVFTVGLKIALCFNSKEITAFEFDVIPSVPLSFSWKPSLCPFPPLHTELSFNIDIKINFTGLEIWDYEIIKPVEKSWDVYRSQPYQTCMFDSKNVQESTINGTFTMDKYSYVIDTKYGQVGNVDNEPGISISMTLYNDTFPIKAVMVPTREQMVLYEKYPTKKKISILDVDNIDPYSINIFAIELNKNSVAEYEGNILIADVAQTNFKSYNFTEDSFVQASPKRVLGIDVELSKSVRIDIGKEFHIVKDDLSHVCFTTKDGIKYAMFYKRNNEDYIWAKTSEFFSECHSGSNQYIGSYLGGRMGILTPSHRIITYNAAVTTLMFFYYNNNVCIGKIDLPTRPQLFAWTNITQTAEEMGIQNMRLFVDLKDCKSIYTKSVERDEQEKIHETEIDIINDVCIVTIYKKAGDITEYQQIFFDISYSDTTVMASIPSDTKSLMIIQNIEARYDEKYEGARFMASVSDKYISVTYTNLYFDKEENCDAYIPLYIDENGQVPIVEHVHIQGNFYMIKFNKENYNGNSYTFQLRDTGRRQYISGIMYPPINIYEDGTFWYDPEKYFKHKTYTYGCISTNDVSEGIVPTPQIEHVDGVLVDNGVFSKIKSYDNNIIIYYYTPHSEKDDVFHFIDKYIFLQPGEISRTMDVRYLQTKQTNYSFKLKAIKSGDVKFLIRYQAIDSQPQEAIYDGERYGDDVLYDLYAYNKFSITVFAICSNLSETYCLLNYSTNNSYKKFVYKSTDAIASINDEVHFSKGVNNALVRISKNDYVWKTWDGEISISDETNFNMNIDIYSDYTVLRFSHKTRGNNNISMSTYNIGNDIIETMNKLFVDSQTYNKETMEFSRDYDSIIIYKDSKIKEMADNNKQNLLNSLSSNAKWMLGVDEKYDLDVTPVLNDHRENSIGSIIKKNIHIIIPIFAGIVAVVVVAVIIVYIKHKRNNIDDEQSTDKSTSEYIHPLI
jgi:hypothetical protein